MLKVNNTKDLVKILSNTIERGCDVKFQIMDIEEYSYINYRQKVLYIY